MFLDDDVTVRPDCWPGSPTLAAEHPEVGVFGGPNDTPEGSTRFQFVQGAAMASMAGAGPVRRRYGVHPAGPADERFFILCNLAVRREVMRAVRPRPVCAEENALLHELRRAGVPMHFDPSLVVLHERRPTVSGFGRQMHKYGRGRGQLMVRRRPSTSSRRFSSRPRCSRTSWSPPIAARSPSVSPLALLPLAAYAASSRTGAVAIAATLRKPTTLPLAAAADHRAPRLLRRGGAARPHRTPATARRARRVGVDRRDGRGRADPGAGRTGVNGSSARPTGAPVIVLDGVSESYRTRNKMGFRRRGREHLALRDLT